MSETALPIKLWLDDVRRPPSEEWAWGKTVEDAIEILATGTIIEASLDNDLHPYERDGLEVVEWMTEHGVWPEVVHVHSSNRFASTKICGLLERHGYRKIPGRPRSFTRSDSPRESPAEFLSRNLKHSPLANEKLR